MNLYNNKSKFKILKYYGNNWDKLALKNWKTEKKAQVYCNLYCTKATYITHYSG